MIKPYYLLLGRDNKHAPWAVAFGDYVRKVVAAESAHQKSMYKYRKIVKADSDSVADVNKAINQADIESIEFNGTKFFKADSDSVADVNKAINQADIESIEFNGTKFFELCHNFASGVNCSLVDHKDSVITLGDTGDTQSFIWSWHTDFSITTYDITRACIKFTKDGRQIAEITYKCDASGCTNIIYLSFKYTLTANIIN